ncbi:MAG: metallophosphoesterase, partial [Blastocatellia bacterium]|nr:metallophosphoesterase [Blastocatellia bacterium]
MNPPETGAKNDERLSVKFSPRRWTRRDLLRISAASAASFGLGFSGYGVLMREHVEVSRVDVKLTNLPAEFSGMTIAHMSDIHHGRFTDLAYIDDCVQIVNGLKPDLVALTGDFTFGGRRYIGPCVEVLKGLEARAGIYAALGNHDHYVGARAVARALKNEGIKLLIDEVDCIELGGSRLWLLGVDDLWCGQTDINRLMKGLPPDEPKVVLSHNPDFIEEFAAREKQIDLMISGHTHGGQIRFPLIGAPQISSDYGQRYAIGLNRKGSMQVYTTRGIGTIIVPARLNCPPEIVLYKLV